jgi:hypothetical protein
LTSGITDEGVGVYDSLDQIEADFRLHNWSDGLAFTAPTVERVDRFLEFSHRDPDEVIAVLRPANIAATPRNIAANAVMAGCRPEDMAVLSPAAEALMDPVFNIDLLGSTTGRHPFLVLNGPVVEQLGIESGISATSCGPNPAIGRALGLIVRNIAGYRPGEMYAGTHGYFLPFVLAEDPGVLARIGWDPLSGLQPDVSAVSLGHTLNFGPGGRTTSGTDIQAILELICREIVKRVNLHMMAYYPTDHMAVVLITPCQAEAIAAAGYSKRDLESHLLENSLTTIADLEFDLRAGSGGGDSTTLRKLIDDGLSTCPREWLELEPAATIPVLCDGRVRVVVAGNPNRASVMVLHSPFTRDFVPREIRIAEQH